MKTFNILIADDDDGMLATYKFILQGINDYQLHFARNRLGAYQVLDQFLVDKSKPVEDTDKVLALAILDQNLTDPDPKKYREDWSSAGGITLIPEIKAVFLPTRVIIYTAYFATLENKGFEACKFGADGYFSKIEDVESGAGGNVLRAKVKKELKRFDADRLKFNKNLEEKEKNKT